LYIINNGPLYFTLSFTTHCKEVRFASFLSGGFITAIVVNPPEMKLAKSICVHWFEFTRVAVRWRCNCPGRVVCTGSEYSTNDPFCYLTGDCAEPVVEFPDFKERNTTFNVKTFKENLQEQVKKVFCYQKLF
jgi:hypothetical protein